jgi:hypothetical protein
MSRAPRVRRVFICASCRSPHVVVSCLAQWNVLAQNWEVTAAGVMEKGHYCAECDAPCLVTTRMLSPEEESDADKAYATALGAITPPVDPGATDVET